jgi:signal transduction histidine kinase
VWPASGVSLAGLLLLGWRAGPAIVIGGFHVGDSIVTGWALIANDALRIGQMGVSAVTVVVAGIAVWATLNGYGPFSHLPYMTSLIVLEAFNASIATTSLLLRAAVATTKGLSDANDRLHAEVRRQLDEVRASRARIVQAAEGERRRIERNLHDRRAAAVGFAVLHAWPGASAAGGRLHGRAAGNPGPGIPGAERGPLRVA